MNSIKYRQILQDSKSDGLTLIEVMLYVSLLSLLMSGFLKFSLETNYQNILLSQEIFDAY